MKKNKGFTLIELLAVIVILAIIALITVPVVINIINSSKKGAAEASAYGAIDAARLFYYQASIDSNTSTIEFTYDGNEWKYNGNKLEFTGTKPVPGSDSSSFKVNNGNVELKDIKFGAYICNKELTVEKVTCSTDSSSSEENVQYAYSTATKGYDPSDPSTISDTKPTDRDTYLRYKLINGVIQEGVLPEVCYDNESHGGELCLKFDDFSNSMQKIKTYFKYNENPSVCNIVNDDEFNSITCTYIDGGYIEAVTNNLGYARVTGSGAYGCDFWEGASGPEPRCFAIQAF